MVDRLLTGITAQQKGTTAQWYSNKTSLIDYFFELFPKGVNFLKETLYCLFINTFKHEYKCPLGLTYFQWNSVLPFDENKSMTSAILSATFSDERRIY